LQCRKVCSFKERFEIIVWNFIVGKVEGLQLARLNGQVKRGVEVVS